MAKKHQFHCGHCGLPCTMYRKGKGHRILLCPHHGVIATNPLPLLALAAPALISGGKKLFGSIAGKAVEKIGAPKEAATTRAAQDRIIFRDIIKTELVDID